MEITTTILSAGCALVLVIGVIAGYLVGVRLSKSRRRQMQRSLNETNLELLDVRTENRQLSQFLGAAERKDRLLKLTLKKLKLGNLATNALHKNQQNIDRKHFIEKSRLNLAAIEANQRAKKAAAVARKASFRLRLLERALPQLQTITAHEPKSYGQGEAVTVSVVDKHGPAATRDHANQVSNRDLHRLTSMQPSNEQVRTRPDNTVSFPPSTQKSAPKNAPLSAQKRVSNEQAEQSLNKKETAKRAN